MCLSSVYQTKNETETLICEYVSGIRVEGTAVILTDVLGEEISVEGVLLSVDLINNRVLIAAA